MITITVPRSFQPRSKVVPNPFQSRSINVQQLMVVYEEIMRESAMHLNPDEEIRAIYADLSPSELEVIGHVFLGLAKGKKVTPQETKA